MIALFINLILRNIVQILHQQSIIIIQTFQSVCQEKLHIFVNKFIYILDFDILKQDDTRYADDDQTSLLNFGSVALFSEAKLTTSSGKNLEKVDDLHIKKIMHKLITSQQQTSEVMYAFEES